MVYSTADVDSGTFSAWMELRSLLLQRAELTIAQNVIAVQCPKDRLADPDETWEVGTGNLGQ